MLLTAGCGGTRQFDGLRPGSSKAGSKTIYGNPVGTGMGLHGAQVTRMDRPNVYQTVLPLMKGLTTSPLSM